MIIREDMDLDSLTNQAFIKYFQSKGYNLRVIRPKDVDLYTTHHSKENNYPHVVFARTGARSDGHTLLLIQELEAKSIPVINNYDSIIHASNKYLQYSLLNQHGIPVAKTYLLTNHDISSDANIEHLIEKKLRKKLGLQFPVVLKYCFGSGGVEVLKIDTKHELEVALNIFQIERKDLDNYTQTVVIQEMVKETQGKSLRVLVIGDEVVASYYRENEGDWRSNARQGSEFKNDYPLSESTKKLCVDATQVLGLEFSGVDLLFADESKDEFIVSEVNSCSGFEPKDTEFIPQKFCQYLIQRGVLDPL